MASGSFYGKKENADRWQIWLTLFWLSLLKNDSDLLDETVFASHLWFIVENINILFLHELFAI
jgi:hypothetical protein